MNPTSLFGGLIAVGTCAFLAGTFLVADAERSGNARLAGEIRARALAVGLLTGVLVFTALLPIAHDAPILADGLKGRAAPMVVLAAAGGLTTMTLLWTRRYAIARLSAVVAVTAVVSGWGLGQYPWLLVDQVTIADAAGATATLKGLLVAVGLAVVIVVPPLAYLLRLTQTEAWSRH